MRKIITALVLSAVVFGCSRRDRQAENRDNYVCENVRVVSAYTALVEKPDAANALFIGDWAKSLTNYFTHAGVECHTMIDGKFDLIAIACGELSKESCAKVCSHLNPGGALVWYMDMRGVASKKFRSMLKEFDLKDVRLWMPGESRWMLVGSPAARRPKLSAMLDIFAREGTFDDMAVARCGTLPEFFANYVGKREDVMPAFSAGDLSAEARPEFFITREIPPHDWFDAAGVDEDIRRGVLNEMRSAQVVRRLVVEGNLASAQAKDKKSEEAAIEKWAKAALRNPNDLFIIERFDRLSRNAKGFLEVGKVLMAMKCYETMVLIQPKDAAAVHNFGMCLKKIGKLDMATKVLERAKMLEARNDVDTFPGEMLDLTNEKSVSVECHVRTTPTDNPFYTVLLAHGEQAETNGFELTFNEAYRDRRVRARCGSEMAETEPFALDDGKWHLLRLDMTAGQRAKFSFDGKVIGEFAAPRQFTKAKIYAAQRKERYGCRDLNNRFRGELGGIRIAGRRLPDVEPEIPDPDPPDAKWERPKTTRRYFQGPLSERLLTLWCEGKVMFGEIAHVHDWKLPYHDQRAHGIWLVHGRDDRPYDFHTAKNRLPSDGTPVHSLTLGEGPLTAELEVCAPFGRQPTASVRLTVTNRSKTKAKEDFALLVRSGREIDMLFGVSDIYKPYAPELAQWNQLTSTWHQVKGGVWRDGDRFFVTKASEVRWDDQKGAARFGVELAAGATQTFDFALGRGETPPVDYEAARARAIADWQTELARMRLPDSLLKQPDYARAITNLVVQDLQCMALPAGGDEPIIPRQGGMQRYCWPYENMPVMAALGKLGYGDYVEKTISLYFDWYQQPDGKIAPFAYEWACITATAVGTWARYCFDTDNAECWAKYREKAYRAFEWVARTRVKKDDKLIAGFFAPLRSCDWDEQIQHWGGTDLYNVEGLRWYATAARHFNDRHAKTVTKEYEDYLAAFRRTLAACQTTAKGNDELRIPVTPDGNDEKLLKTFYPALHYGFFAQEGLLSTNDIGRVRTWLLRRGMATGRGLYGFFPNWAGGPKSHRHHWYTSFGDLPWYLAWRKVGRNDLADQILSAQFKYSMTDEFYMGERFQDNNPWYFPWSPNASANGRTILMLLEQEKENKP